MKQLVLICFLFVSVGVEAKELAKKSIREISQITSMVKRPDGKFDVTCIDGSVEVKTAEDIYYNKVCEFNVDTYSWVLVSGGSKGALRLCDIQTEEVSKNGAFVSKTARFLEPCLPVKSTSFLCPASDTCEMEIGGELFTLVYKNSSQMTITRFGDGLTGEYEAN